MIVAHFVSWKRKWRRCSSFVQTLWILHTGRGAFCLLTILYFLVPLRFHDVIANIINHKSYINLSNIWRCGYWPSDSLLHITVVRKCNLRNLFLFWQLLQPASLVQLSTFARAWWLAYCFRAPEQCNCICAWEFAKNHSFLQIKEKTFMEKIGDKSFASLLRISCRPRYSCLQLIEIGVWKF